MMRSKQLTIMVLLIAGMMLPTARIVPAEELILHWPLDEPGEQVVHDASGHERSGALQEGDRHHAGPRFVAGVGWREGALFLGSRHAVAADTELPLPETFMVSFFLRKQLRSSRNWGLFKLGEMTLAVEGDNVTVHVPGMGRITASRQTPGQWEHVAIMVGPGQVQVFINGALAAEQAKEGWRFPESAVLSFHGGSSGWSHFEKLPYDELIDDVRVYAGVLDAAAVAELAADLYREDAPWMAGYDPAMQKVIHAGAFNRPDVEALQRLNVLDDESLLEAVRTREDLQVLARLALVLGARPNDTTVDALTNLLGRSDRLRVQQMDTLRKSVKNGHLLILRQEELARDAARLREQIAQSLGMTGAADAIPVLIGQCADSNEHVRAAARQSLVGLGDMSIPALRNALYQPGSMTAQLAAEALDELKAEPMDAVETLRRMIARGQWDQIRVSEFDDWTPLGRTLDSTNPAQVNLAANELALRGSLALDAVLPVLEEGTVSGRRAAARVCGLLADSRAVAPLADCLKSDDYVLQEIAACALKTSAGEDQVDALVAVLASPNGPSREAAAVTLAEIGPSAVDSVLKTLARGQPVARVHAAEVLGWIGDQRAEAGLSKAADSPDFALRAASLEALGCLPDPPFRDLLHALDDKDWLVRRQAVMALRRLDTHLARQVLVRVQEDEHPLVRRALEDDLDHLRAMVPVERLSGTQHSVVTDEKIVLSPLDAVLGEPFVGQLDRKGRMLTNLASRGTSRVFWMFTAPSDGLYRIQFVQQGGGKDPVRQELRIGGRPGVNVCHTLGFRGALPVVAGVVRVHAGESLIFDYEAGGTYGNFHMSSVELIKVEEN
jgi:HEAT repeat protein